MVVKFALILRRNANDTSVRLNAITVFGGYASLIIFGGYILYGHFLAIRSANVMRVVREPIREALMAKFLASITQEFNTQPKIKYLCI